ncbi:MAG: BrxA family protein [Syntrophobacteraceae bacterium]
MVEASRAQVVSSFTIIKGSLIEETYLIFQNWDFTLSKRENLQRVKETNSIGATSVNWLRDVAKVLNRRFDPGGRDRPLVELVQARCNREIWTPLLLWHIIRDEFLVRHFLIDWLFTQYTNGAYRLRSEDLFPYLESLAKNGFTSTEAWAGPTLKRVAAGLLRIAVDFRLMSGTTTREFIPYHIPEESFLYLLHAMAEDKPSADSIVRSPDWRMFMLLPEDVEREILRLHQYRKLHYEVAGSLSRLELPCTSLLDYAREMVR